MQAAFEEASREAISLPGMKKGGVGNWLWLTFFSLRNWFVSWAFFLPNFALSLAGMVTGAAIYYMMGEMVAAGAQSHITRYGLSYGSYIITGVMFNLIMNETMDAYHNAYLRGYWTGQFDVYLQHPGGVSSLLTGEVLAKYLVAGLNTMIYFLVGAWLFGIPAQIANVLAVVATLVLAMLALTGVGLLGASTFTLLNAKREETNPVKLFFDFGVTLLAGVYFPPSVLPGWLQSLGAWLPQTHALDAARLCLGGQATLSSPAVVNDLLFLLGFTAVSLPLGLWAFVTGLRKAEREGSLTRWN